MSKDPLDCELSLSSPGTVRQLDPWTEALSCPLRLSGGQDTYGEAVFDPERLTQLQELADDPEGYGSLLFRLLFPASSRQERGFREIRSKARSQRRRLRLRLHLLANLPTSLHTLEWERLFDPEDRQFLACSRETPFSRFCTVPRDPGEPTRGKPRVLGVISSPRSHDLQIPELTPRQIAAARAGLATLAPALELDILDPPSTPQKLRDAMARKPYHALLFFGHGLLHRTPTRDRRAGGPRQRASLVLENDDGSPHLLDEGKLAHLLGDQSELRLVTLIACHGGAPSSQSDSFSGLAGRLVERGCPAVLGMSRAVTIDAGLLFTEHLYRTLAATGRVDVAANEARQQLYLDDSLSPAWSSPRLFLRLEDGRLWRAPRRDRWRGPTAASLAAAALLTALAGGPVHQAEVELELHTRGVGFELDRDHAVIDRLPLTELATSHLHRIDLPQTLGGQSILAEDLPASPLGLVVRTLPEEARQGRQTDAPGPGSSLALQGQRLTAGTSLYLEQAELSDGLRYQLFLRGPLDHFWIDLAGSVEIKLLHQPAETHTDRAPTAIHLASEGDDILFDLKLAPIDGTGTRPSVEAPGDRSSGVSSRGFVAGIPIRRLELTTDRITHHPEGSRAQQIDLVESCRVHFPSTGQRYELSQGERLRLQSLRGTLLRLSVDAQGLRFLYRGNVSELAVVGTDPASLPRNLMPSLLATSFGHRLAPALVSTLLGLTSLGVVSPWLVQRRRDLASRRQQSGRPASIQSR